jgi:hypothetical protein
MSSFVRFSEGFSKESTGLLLDASESRDVFHAGAEGRDFLVGVFLVNLALGVAGHLHTDFLGNIGFRKPTGEGVAEGVEGFLGGGPSGSVLHSANDTSVDPGCFHDFLELFGETSPAPWAQFDERGEKR